MTRSAPPQHVDTSAAEKVRSGAASVPSGRAPGAGGRRLRAAAITVAVVAALGLGTYTWISATSTPTATGVPDCGTAPVTGPALAGGAEHVAVCSAIGALTAAWNAGDADAYGAAFTADATYTSWIGTHYAGREDIVEGHRALFGGVLAGTRLTDSYLSVRFVHPDVAVVSTRGDTYEGADPPRAPGKVQTYTVVRDGERWRIASFHNTKRNALMERIQFLVDPGSRPIAER
ncbi:MULTISPECIES: SgcJ/EcaC family oxidoreductase [Pseudonocardia]|uniref:DUF4440 domain-containing protein n=2 Tax=Pseudonocardia TaxID=1847 RepID=A0A1Y2N3Q3_PSEAH|nr:MULTISPECIES: SgcJ/EcaC family oxidoreductase [Pseudonocardia]OSY41518.1 hypothetical protein BG845_02009 [Pseudonocardia autotrophica]TDN71473.1 uncharacterized protein (TIGR02246 family) [Pseudonocardia autotrophica]BBG02149.1 hypothetical protein Pdca_33580 [Pseudonocardia autotrophica]GEC24163.1 hypothetical protein PSA01_11920 [Pseudonocardia saturnea]